MAKQSKINDPISIEKPSGTFQEHLSQENNRRIFFSGKFGMGKTYFLKEFFVANQDKYEVFFLRPINYQISRNADIIDLVKLDLLVELLCREDNIFVTKGNKRGVIDKTLLIGEFIRNNKVFMTTSLLGSVGVLNKPMRNIQGIVDKIQEFENEKSKEDMKSIVSKFIQESQAKNINETDIISALIGEGVGQVKGRSSLSL